MKLGSEDLSTAWQMGHMCRWDDHCGCCQGDTSEGVEHGPHGTGWWMRRDEVGRVGGEMSSFLLHLKSSKMEMADSGLDMISSRPKEPERVSRVSLLWPRAARAKRPGKLRHVYSWMTSTLLAIPLGGWTCLPCFLLHVKPSVDSLISGTKHCFSTRKALNNKQAAQSWWVSLVISWTSLSDGLPENLRRQQRWDTFQ